MSHFSIWFVWHYKVCIHTATKPPTHTSTQNRNLIFCMYRISKKLISVSASSVNCLREKKHFLRKLKLSEIVRENIVVPTLLHAWWVQFTLPAFFPSHFRLCYTGTPAMLIYCTYTPPLYLYCTVRTVLVHIRVQYSAVYTVPKVIAVPRYNMKTRYHSEYFM